MALAVVLALIAGKLIGVSILVLAADKIGCAPVNKQIRKGDVAMVASMASVGLTVALFVAGVAFRNDARLQVRKARDAPDTDYTPRAFHACPARIPRVPRAQPACARCPPPRL